MIVEDGVDESDGEGARRVDVLAGERQLRQVAGAHDLGQSLQRAEVGDDGDLRLAHREYGVARAQSKVTGALPGRTPAPMQYPCTAAITGIDSSAIDVIDACISRTAR